jgi:hypothetical protein
MAEDFEKTQVNLEVTLDIDDQLTWGELLKFADLARARHIDPNEPVVIQYSEPGHSISGVTLYLLAEDLGTRTTE